MTAKFVLVDSNISGAGGHYLEYAEQVFEAVEAMGYQTHLVANTSFRPPAAYRRVVHPALPFDMWGKNLALDKDASNAFTATDREVLRHGSSKLGLLWTAAADLPAVAAYAAEVSLPLREAYWLRRVARIRAAVDAEEASADRGSPREAVPATQAADRERRARRLRRMIRTAAVRATAPQPPVPQTAQLCDGAMPAEANRRALATIVEGIGLGSTDIVFVPTLSFSEARGLRDLLAGSAAARRPLWALLFRRELYRGPTVQWDSQEWNVHAVRNLFNSFHRLPGETRLAFLTDTDELRRQYDRLNAGAFQTVAIPVRKPPGQRREFDAALQSKLERGGRSRLAVRFLRDPAHEHGCDYLSQVLDAFPPESLSRIRVHVTEQALAAPPDLIELGPIERARLRAYLPDVVRITEPDPASRGDILVLVEPRGLENSSLETDARAFLSRFRAVVAPVDSRVLDEIERVRLQAGHGAAALFIYGEGMSSADTAANLASALDRAIATLDAPGHSKTAERPPWVLGYLGDARQEKGFHLLSQLPAMLEGHQVEGRPVLIYSQLFHPAPAADIEALLALARMREAPPGTVLGEPRALPTADYQTMLGSSDVIFNVYDRDNYRARSSGVFVEALAARKPVLTTAGTWMSALLGGLALPYHRSVIAPEAITSEHELGGSAAPWRRNQRGGTEQKVPFDAVCLSMQSVFTTCVIPGRATHLWIEGDFEASAPDAVVHLVVAWRDRSLHSVREEYFVLNRLGGAPLSVVLEAWREAGNIWLGVWSDTPDAGIRLFDWRLRWLRSQDDIACLPGGAAIPTLGEPERRTHAYNALLHILQRYDAYRDSCDWLARNWADHQTADRLARQVIGAASVAPQRDRRLIGREW